MMQFRPQTIALKAVTQCYPKPASESEKTILKWN
ncbi:unnamed protein product [Chironomus riparius]|uniref:Uncharacterized protein n=1 Tax=Chironomus riparius TaxID=315576 RepID=A0A9N9RQA5_9DIPT|nr:unnamed protein product [Chironomus riparius]